MDNLYSNLHWKPTTGLPHFSISIRVASLAFFNSFGIYNFLKNGQIKFGYLGQLHFLCRFGRFLCTGRLLDTVYGHTMLNFYWKLCTKIHYFLFCCFMVLDLQLSGYSSTRPEVPRSWLMEWALFFMYEICIYCLLKQRLRALKVSLCIYLIFGFLKGWSELFCWLLLFKGWSGLFCFWLPGNPDQHYKRFEFQPTGENISVKTRLLPYVEKWLVEHTENVAVRFPETQTQSPWKNVLDLKVEKTKTRSASVSNTGQNVKPGFRVVEKRNPGKPVFSDFEKNAILSDKNSTSLWITTVGLCAIY